MKKMYIFLIVLMILIGIFTGVILNKSKNDKLADVNFSEITDDCIEEKERYDIAMLNLEEVNASTIKVSPNTSITFKNCYKECNHIIVKKEKAKQDIVNLTQEEIQLKYKDWSIEEFTAENITLYKENEGICNEHYVLKQENGYIVVYELDKNKKETLLKITDISTKYLPESDLLEIGKGLTVYTKQELNKILEDYE
ncbi:MAG: hypothetical protein E7310_01330 [Clostridiales bacterium]|nr:hypothetical protein [Clostridiales bacterium]